MGKIRDAMRLYKILTNLSKNGAKVRNFRYSGVEEGCWSGVMIECYTPVTDDQRNAILDILHMRTKNNTIEHSKREVEENA